MNNEFAPLAKPYDEGFRARLRGEPHSTNPHLPGSEIWCQWANGWDDQDEHLNDRDDALASIGWFGKR